MDHPLPSLVPGPFQRPGDRLWQIISENNRCPLALENNLRMIGTAPRNNCIVTPPLLANYNLERYLQQKGNTDAMRTVLSRVDFITVSLGS